MSQISAVLRNVTHGNDGRYLNFWCPGCGRAHMIKVEGTGHPCWSWNGDADKPTFQPSILVQGRDFTPAGFAAYERWRAEGCNKPTPYFESAETVCHSFVTDGRIQFLGDCTHALAGQTVDLPAWPVSFRE